MVDISSGPDERLERHRTELTGYCYRMLGSGFEAEDAVQETLVRAWRAYERYDERRATLRVWLYRIATNVCLDMLRSAQRRALAIDLGPASQAGAALGPPVADERWIHPIPDARAIPAEAGPEEVALRRETIRLAFVAALQHLPARQRAALILCDVLCWTAKETADLLDTTVASVNSALQRARATLRATAPTPKRFDDATRRDLLDRYCAAFERHDIDTLVSLLHEDVRMSMPPFAWWLRGRDQIRLALTDPAGSCAGARLWPVEANGSPAFWQTRPAPDGSHHPFALIVLDVADGAITDIVTFLDAERLTRLFPPMRYDVHGRM
ncbi:sigma-70 family RNA polymerase sigma factor [Herbidospora mongoliensis]|uniref:sigma-70 family RNA polymerase sigma factor n=1 Tax=Herbidospora mongoliensis TaxID=688067 RepID=UPI000AEBB794|nr:sigma-70 family RNA polymerase sigma factor [Herbidospora mongoliensis]